MTDLQKEFEATGYTSWINADLYPDGKIYTQEYTQWLEKQVLALRQPLVSGSLLKSLHQDLKGFQEMGFLTPDAKSGLGIAIEQVERYMRGDLGARQQ